MPARIIDKCGHSLPVTGYRCQVCGLPLHRLWKVEGFHPLCERRTSTAKERQ